MKYPVDWVPVAVGFFITVATAAIMISLIMGLAALHLPGPLLFALVAITSLNIGHIVKGWFQ